MPIMYGSGFSITKHGSAASRTTIESARNILIWIFFMFVPVYGKIVESFSVLQLVGFLSLFLGVLLYNELLVVPILGFNKYTKEAIALREDQEDKETAINENEAIPDLPDKEEEIQIDAINVIVEKKDSGDLNEINGPII